MGLLNWIGRQERAFQFWRQREKIRRLFHREVGFEGDFENPRTHWEKVQYRKLYGNHEFYGRLADKVLVRDYVKERVGEDVLIPLLGVYDRLEDRILDSLPGSFVLKASHASGWNEVVRDRQKMNRRRTIRYFNRKLDQRFSRKFGERHYDFCIPRILAENFIGINGESPWDYRFFCYNGSQGFDCRLCLDTPDGLFSGYFDKGWNLTDGNLSPEMAGEKARPRNLPQMVEIARELSRGIDFVRVDLYSLEGKIYFGELTFTSSAGFKVYENPALNELRDRMWELDRHNPMLYRDPADVRAGKI
jgi:hypothetical protein